METIGRGNSLRVLGRNEAVRIMLRDDMENCDVERPYYDWWVPADDSAELSTLGRESFWGKLCGIAVCMAVSAGTLWLVIWASQEGYKHVNGWISWVSSIL